jgi:hypothetical protein
MVNLKQGKGAKINNGNNNNSENKEITAYNKKE